MFESRRLLSCVRRLPRLKEYVTCKLEKELVLRTNASEKSLWVVLLQERDNVLHPVPHASRKLLTMEAAYATIERDGLALIWGVCKFHPYLYGKHFVLQTAHQPLVHISRTRHASARMMRWSLQLQQYAFCVQYVKGKDTREF